MDQGKANFGSWLGNSLDWLTSRGDEFAGFLVRKGIAYEEKPIPHGTYAPIMRSRGNLERIGGGGAGDLTVAQNGEVRFQRDGHYRYRMEPRSIRSISVDTEGPALRLEADDDRWRFKPFGFYSNGEFTMADLRVLKLLLPHHHINPYSWYRVATDMKEEERRQLFVCKFWRTVLADRPKNYENLKQMYAQWLQREFSEGDRPREWRKLRDMGPPLLL